MIDLLNCESWDGPFGDTLRARAVEKLEGGAVLLFPALPFLLTNAETSVVCAAGLDGSAKNISLDPVTHQCKASSLAGAELETLIGLLNRFANCATTLVEGLFPAYAGGLSRARTSFRPVEIADRKTSWRQDDKRLHVDAFPSRPMQGRRILRVFTNIDPDGAPRRWRIGPTFEAYAQQFLPSLPRANARKSWLLEHLGLTKGRRSRYDEIMLFLHDAAKRDLDWQRSSPAEDVDFVSGCTWIVFTDQVPHAAIAGRNALEQTFYIDPAVLARPETAPLVILGRLCGTVMTASKGLTA